jgi:hypothetical protein
MRARAAALVGAALAVVAGCGPAGSDDPLPTDGPNQVVVKVPTMT